MARSLSRFDTVILDEASMAPIPALWIAAGLADANVIVVGDFKQLPPIKHSEHPLAEQCLGQDIFRVSGVQGAWEAGDPPENLIQLQVQYRMGRQISAIPNALVYAGTLADGDGVDDDSTLDGWYQRDWGYDAPVLLVDMAPLNAWVTSVKTGRVGGSRLNFLSAMVSVDIAERLLRPDRPELPLGERAAGVDRRALPAPSATREPADQGGGTRARGPPGHRPHLPGQRGACRDL